MRLSAAFISQRGLSLVEVMVALVVGMILTAGLIQAFQSHKLSHQANQGFSMLQENSRFSMDMIGRYLRLAGYRDASPNTLEEDFPTSINGTLMASVPAGRVINGVNGSSGTPDSITIRYLGSVLGTSDNCLGSTLVAGQVTNVRFFIQNKKLICKAEILDVNTGAVVSAAAEEILADGVDDMQILYGLDDDNNGSANRYRDASGVTDWQDVVSVRVVLLFNTVIAVETSDIEQKFVLAGTNSGPYKDRLRRRVVGVTVALRN